jgi:hypothetical protein
LDWSSRDTSPPLRLLGIGHSHLTGLQHADGCRAPAPDRTRFHFVQMLEPRFHPNVAGDETGRPILHPALVASMEAARAEGPLALIFAAISGNEHHSLGMVNHRRRFDFVLRERPALPLLPDAEIVPAPLVEAPLAGLMYQAVLQLAALRRATDLPILCVCSPPPVPDDAFVARQDTMFTAAIREHGVSPATLRWKLWRLQTRLFARAAAENGITFLPPPPEALDEHKFLREEAWHGDSVHANIWYGERVLRQIEQAARALAGAAA